MSRDRCAHGRLVDGGCDDCGIKPSGYRHRRTMNARQPARTRQATAQAAPRPQSNVNGGDLYVDQTGTPVGKYDCAECGRAVIIAHHHLRPDGERPVILDAQVNQKGPWRLFAKRDAPDIWLTSFDGAWSRHARYTNHRIICNAATVRK